MLKSEKVIQSFLINRQSIKNCKPRTIKWYADILCKFSQGYTKLPTDPEAIEKFLLNIEKPVNRHGYYRALKAFYRFASKRYDFDNPFHKIDTFPDPQKQILMPTLEPEDLFQILNNAESLRDKALISIFIDNGGRTSELGNIQIKDIHVNYIVVNGKRGVREIPISRESKSLLKALIAKNPITDYVFLGKKGNPLTRYGVYQLIRRIMKKAGINGPKLGGHRIRHAFGKNYLVNGGDLRSLQQIMGHQNITTTQKYASLNLTDIINKHSKYTPLKSAHAAAQATFFDKKRIVVEAEEIIKEGANNG